MRSRGWTIGIDPNVKKNFASISKYHHSGRNALLEVDIELSPRYIEVHFFQNVVFENVNGGKYDFDKLKKMPYLIKLSYYKESQKICDYLHREFSMEIIQQTPPDDAIEHILYNHRSNSFTRNKIKSIHEIPQYMSDYDHKYNSTDRDGKKITCGQLKYFRDWNGRLSRGYAWHNINNMWWVVERKNSLRNIASFDMFDLTDADKNQRRKVKAKIPESYTLKMRNIEHLLCKRSLICIEKEKSSLTGSHHAHLPNE
jgi:hypothetical protein